MHTLCLSFLGCARNEKPILQLEKDMTESQIYAEARNRLSMPGARKRNSSFLDAEIDQTPTAKRGKCGKDRLGGTTLK